MFLLRVKAGSRKLRPGSPETFPGRVGSDKEEAEALGRNNDFMVSTGLASPNFLEFIKTTYAPPDDLCCPSPSRHPLLCYLYDTASSSEVLA